MAVYVDAEGIGWRGREWCHLVADSLDELHSFADRLGLKRSWFQSKTLYPHYDVTKSVRTRALAMGAKGADREQIVRCAKRMRSEMIQLYRTASQSA
ncbi:MULTISPECIES: DUF4031 domain-containing protein [unclassified Pseudomonas]|uniref:DUF4031 domain-containing protein n=1 Tax=unclassified Pseudomonas TaxID=196821 RepID=UPI000A1E8AF0|nr:MULTISPECIES: DUF4031 domain-containing protein [unclassified Pseudomonas]MDI2141302.1 DUF4031 domain-containing protein [Pseudomonas sp. ITA]